MKERVLALPEKICRSIAYIRNIYSILIKIIIIKVNLAEIVHILVSLIFTQLFIVPFPFTSQLS